MCRDIKECRECWPRDMERVSAAKRRSAADLREGVLAWGREVVLVALVTTRKRGHGSAVAHPLGSSGSGSGSCSGCRPAGVDGVDVETPRWFKDESTLVFAT